MRYCFQTLIIAGVLILAGCSPIPDLPGPLGIPGF